MPERLESALASLNISGRKKEAKSRYPRRTFYRQGAGLYRPEDEDVEKLFDRKIAQGQQFNTFFQTPVEVEGKGLKQAEIPTIGPSFDDSGLPPQILKNLSRCAYERTTPVQRYGVALIKEKRDVLACSPTGSGKTIAYLLPVIAEMITNEKWNQLEMSNESDNIPKPRVIIMAPTHELAKQIYNEARKIAHKTGVRTVLLCGGISRKYQLKHLKVGCDILVVTPGRFLNELEYGNFRLENLQFVVIDEADRMLFQGFEQNIADLFNHPDMPSEEQMQVLMFSATFPKAVQKLARDYLEEEFTFLKADAVGSANKCIKQTVIRVGYMEKQKILLELLKINENYDVTDESICEQKTLVFVERKKDAKKLEDILTLCELKVTSIHSDKLQEERDLAIRDFREGKIPILIATAVAGRGLDIAGVDHVINFDLPKTVHQDVFRAAAEYVQRIGRTGRVGNAGYATSFYDYEVDKALAGQLVAVISNAQQEVPDFLLAAAGFPINAKPQDQAVPAKLQTPTPIVPVVPVGLTLQESNEPIFRTPQARKNWLRNRRKEAEKQQHQNTN